MAENFEGTVNVRDQSNQATIRLQANNGRIGVGANGKNGTVNVYDSADHATVRLQGGEGRVGVGGNTKSGTVNVYDKDNHATIRLQGEQGRAGIGGNTQSGTVNVYDKDNHATIRLQGAQGRVGVGGNSVDGELNIYDAENHATIRLSGKTGDIILANADCAEAFPVADTATALPGTVMVLDDDGTTMPSSRSYDTRVVGIVSGAGPYRPAIVLNGQMEERHTTLALIGTVHCNVVADGEPIRAGDLLTTSPVPGHAMRATDPARSFGAVLGKALKPFAAGQGTIPVLVCLQ
jgi:hypothetical protein